MCRRRRPRNVDSAIREAQMNPIDVQKLPRPASACSTRCSRRSGATSRSWSSSAPRVASRAGRDAAGSGPPTDPAGAARACRAAGSSRSPPAATTRSPTAIARSGCGTRGSIGRRRLRTCRARGGCRGDQVQVPPDREDADVLDGVSGTIGSEARPDRGSGTLGPAPMCRWRDGPYRRLQAQTQEAAMHCMKIVVLSLTGALALLAAAGASR